MSSDAPGGSLDRFQRAEESMQMLVKAGKEGGRGVSDHSILAGGVFDELVERVRKGEGASIHVLNIGAGYRARMERELSKLRGDEQEPFFIIDSPTFSNVMNKEGVLKELQGDNVTRAVTIEDFAHNLESVPDNFCDYVFVVNVFQHMLSQDIPGALKEIVRVLRPGAKAVLVPLYEPLEGELEVPGNRPDRMPGAYRPSAERFMFPQLELLRIDLKDLPRGVDVPIQITREEIPLDSFVRAQGGDPTQKPKYVPYRIVIQKLSSQK